MSTVWADKFWDILGIFSQTISTHFGTVSPLSMFSIIQPFGLARLVTFSSQLGNQKSAFFITSIFFIFFNCICKRIGTFFTTFFIFLCGNNVFSLKSSFELKKFFLSTYIPTARFLLGNRSAQARLSSAPFQLGSAQFRKFHLEALQLISTSLIFIWD